jgi:hypothetical protein
LNLFECLEESEFNLLRENELGHEAREVVFHAIEMAWVWLLSLGCGVRKRFVPIEGISASIFIAVVTPHTVAGVEVKLLSNIVLVF